MTCKSKALAFAKLALGKLGVSGGASRAAYTRAIATGLVATGLVGLSGYSRWRKQSSTKPEPEKPEAVNYRSLPRLVDRPQIQPATTWGIRNERCADCGARSSKPGPWYFIGTKAYCSDCAPDAAREANVSLAVPSSSPTGSSTVTATVSATTAAQMAAQQRTATLTGRASPLYQQAVTATKAALPAARKLAPVKASISRRVELADGKSGEIKVEAHVLLTEDGHETGLAIAPTLYVTQEGLRVKPNAWSLVHTDQGIDLMSDLPTPQDALEMGQELGRFDWTRPPGAFTPVELEAVKDIAARKIKAIKERRITSGAITEKKKSVSGSLPPPGTSLKGQLIVDDTGNVVRVQTDLKETLVVRDQFGQTYNTPRSQARYPDTEDFANSGMVAPVELDDLEDEDKCQNCGNKKRATGDDAWYEFQDNLYCGHCMRIFAPSLNRLLPDQVL